jgi:hypothetical protein
VCVFAREWTSLRSRKRDTGTSRGTLGVDAGLRRANAQRRVGYKCDRVIPLEPLATGTMVVHMGSLAEIDLILTFGLTCWTAHGPTFGTNEELFYKGQAEP